MWLVVWLIACGLGLLRHQTGSRQRWERYQRVWKMWQRIHTIEVLVGVLVAVMSRGQKAEAANCICAQACPCVVV